MVASDNTFIGPISLIDLKSCYPVEFEVPEDQANVPLAQKWSVLDLSLGGLKSGRRHLSKTVLVCPTIKPSACPKNGE